MRSTGHAGELVVHTEVVLKGDRGEGLVFLFDLHALFGFNGLVNTFGPATTLENTAGELVDDLHLAALHDVVLVALVQLFGLQGDRELVHEVCLDVVVQVVDLESSFDALNSFFERDNDSLVFLDLVVDIALQRAHDRCEAIVKLGRVG